MRVEKGEEAEMNMVKISQVASVAVYWSTYIQELQRGESAPAILTDQHSTSQRTEGIPPPQDTHTHTPSHLFVRSHSSNPHALISANSPGLVSISEQCNEERTRLAAHLLPAQLRGSQRCSIEAQPNRPNVHTHANTAV